MSDENKQFSSSTASFFADLFEYFQEKEVFLDYNWHLNREFSTIQELFLLAANEGSLLEENRWLGTMGVIRAGQPVPQVGYNLSKISSHRVYAANDFESTKKVAVQVKNDKNKGVGSASCWMGDFITWLHLKRVGYQANKSLVAGYISQNIPEPFSALSAQLLFGRTFARSDILQHLFEVTGTLYVVAVSGFHLSMIASIALRFFSKVLSRAKVACAALLLIWAYVLLLDFSPSIIRAVIMITYGVTARYVLLRQYNPRFIFVLLLVLYPLLSPEVLGHIGFQLSFAATAVILWAYPLVFGSFSRIELLASMPYRHIVFESMLLSCTIQLLIAPLLIYHFQFFTLLPIILAPVIAFLVPPLYIVLLIVLGLGMLVPAALLATSWVWQPLIVLLGSAFISLFQAVSALSFFSWQVTWPDTMQNSTYLAIFFAFLLGVILIRFIARRRSMRRQLAVRVSAHVLLNVPLVRHLEQGGLQ